MDQCSRTRRARSCAVASALVKLVMAYTTSVVHLVPFSRRVLRMIWMAWRTLDIPNTQSATGILYVAVLGVFIGELTGLLLSADSAYPL